MIYFFHGTNAKSARIQAHKLANGLLARKPNASLFHIDSENFSEAIMEELAAGQGLFEQKYIVFCDKLCDGKEIQKTFLQYLSKIQTSQNIFIFLEEKLDAKTASLISKKSEKTQKYDAGEKKKPVFDIFSLTDALGARDKRRTWSLFQKAMYSGMSAEEICSMLVWQVRSILLAVQAKDADEAGLKPFVFSKAHSFAKNFTKNELKNLSSDFVSLYHDTRRGKVDFETGLEHLILTSL